MCRFQPSPNCFKPHLTGKVSDKSKVSTHFLHILNFSMYLEAREKVIAKVKIRVEGLEMAEHTRFGPAGVPPMFRLLGATIADVPKLLHEEGLDAFEYQASRWGPKPQMKQEDAIKLGEESRKNDVKLSMHGSYFVNLSGKKETVEASKRRLIASHWVLWQGGKKFCV
jgi:hypothetical protein